MAQIHDAAKYSHRDRVQIKRALISVSDKTGLLEFARQLHEAGVALVSTGSTAAQIAQAGIPVVEVSDVTKFPESLDGRVKTLHPKIHGGILADLRLQEHREELEQLEIEPFELVVVNLYPFVETVASGAPAEQVIEQIDIGGPAMVRASAKNHANVAIVVDPSKYQLILDAIAEGGTTVLQRRELALGAFSHTAQYDTAVAGWLAGQLAPAGARSEGRNPGFETVLRLEYQLDGVLRYGENSHQAAALYRDSSTLPGIAQARQLGGKEMSYNNYVDADAALRAAYDFVEPAVAIVKHANPCGIAIAALDSPDAIASAYARAHACDPVSAFGGVIAANSTVTLAMAEGVSQVFTEVIIAPAYELEALELLLRKKNLRVLELSGGFKRSKLEHRQVSGGLLLQESDGFDELKAKSWKLVSGPAGGPELLAELEFAWRACRSVKSNGILLAHQGAAVGVGMGQVNRLDSCRLAVSRAGERAMGSVAASDAFFPFADGLQVLIDAGVKAVVQPGGSLRDEEVIAAAEAAGLTMFFTGERHFFH